MERVRNGGHRNAGNAVIAKIQQLRYRLNANQETNSSVLLIGLDDKSPLTVLEGNHRLTAGLLVSPEVMRKRFRVLCGFSGKMVESCWYRTDIPNLFRYLKNRITHLYDREADVERVCPASPAPAPIAKEKLAKAVVGETIAESQN